jgi:CelD/BcsL family acetyltransferase involved in cellulose biosynthesis
MFVGDTDLWDYHKVIVENSKMEEFFPPLLDYIKQLSWSVMDLSSLQETSNTYQGILSVVKKTELKFDVNREDVSPGVQLPSTWDEYLSNLSKKNRHELRRKIRKLESQASFKWFSVDGHSFSNGGLDDFFSLMRDSRHDKAMFLTPERERFFRRIAFAMGEAGYLKLFFMEIDGERVAAAWCFDMGNVRYLYNSGFNPEYGYLSVGLLLKAFCLKDAIETGMDYYDFLRGDERYKYDLGAQDVTLYNMVVTR